MIETIRHLKGQLCSVLRPELSSPPTATHSRLGVPGSPGARRDLLILLAGGFLFFAVMAQTDLLEAWSEWSRTQKDWELDEITLTLAVLSFSLVWFSFRRWSEASKEAHQRRIAAQELAREMSDRQATEHELRTSEERYRALVTASASVLWRAAPDGAITHALGWAEYTGQAEGDYNGAGWLHVVHPEDQEQAASIWREALASGSPVELRYRVRRADGEYRWVIARAVSLKNADGTVREWVGTLADIHEYTVAQKVLWDTNERLASALRAARMMAWDWDLVTGRVTRSDTSIDVLGFPSGDIKDFLDRIHSEDRASYLSSFELASRTGGSYEIEYRFQRPEGHIAWLRETGQINLAADGNPIRARGLVFDVSEHKQAELLREESERRLSTLLDNLPGCAYRCLNTPDWPMEYISEGVREIVGYAPADFVGPNALAWADVVHPDDREPIWAQVQEAVQKRRQFELVYRVQTRNGEERWVRERGQGVRRTSGELEALEGFISDITEQWKTTEALRQAQKMEAVGQLTGGIAHDFNNLLTVILGNAEILADDPGNPALTRNLSQMILEAAEKGSELTQHLLAFGRRQSLKPAQVSLDHVVSGMRPLLERTLGEHIELQTELADSLLFALTDRTLLESALLNLAVNARDAMPLGGKLTITTGETVAGPNQGTLPIGQDVVFLTVTDTGIGMPPEILDRVFEPFFTTKEVGRGSGLGLSMVYGFAQQSGGHVAVRSKLGEGTSVTIYLPAVTRLTAEPRPQRNEAVPASQQEHILLVEDEPQVLQFVSSQLLSLGYRITAVSTGPDALNLLEGEQEFDLLFTDVVLPKGLSGVELASRARRLRPGLKVLLTSGYPEEAFQHHGRPDPSIPLLRKPYRRRDLAETLRKALS